MNRILQRILGKIMEKGLRKLAKSKIIRNLASMLSLYAGCIGDLKSIGKFISETGETYTLLEGYRDIIVPRWRGMLKPTSRCPSPNSIGITHKKELVKNVEKILRLHGFSLIGMKVLEIGCHGGMDAYIMAELGARHVHGIDIPEYGIRQASDMTLSDQTLEVQSDRLTYLREQTSRFFDPSTVSRVTFEDLDVVHLNDENIYDAIVSWETMEHVQNPANAFKKIFNALKSGGFSFHEYNPFFSEGGGHSLCTLDFPYGHCRLSPSDFRRYIQMFRPHEQEATCEFYENNLNRMSLIDLETYIREVGFKIISFLPFISKRHKFDIERDILLQTKANYPTVCDKDFLTDSVWVLIQKP